MPLVRETMARPLPSGDICEIRHPQHVRCRNTELAVHLVQRTRRLLVGDRRPMRLAPDNALNTHALHQPGDRAAGDIEALAAQLVPDLAHAVDAPVLFENTADLGAQGFIEAGAVRQAGWISPLRQMIIVGGWGNRQHVADRPSPWSLEPVAFPWLHPVRIPVRVDETHHHFDRRSSSAIAKYAFASGLEPMAPSLAHPCEGSRSPGAARSSRVPAPSSSRPSRWRRPDVCRYQPRPS